MSTTTDPRVAWALAVRAEELDRWNELYDQVVPRPPADCAHLHGAFGPGCPYCPPKRAAGPASASDRDRRVSTTSITRKGPVMTVHEPTLSRGQQARAIAWQILAGLLAFFAAGAFLAYGQIGPGQNGSAARLIAALIALTAYGAVGSLPAWVRDLRTAEDES